jgi:hypothetical protein
MATEAAWLKWEQIHGKKKMKVCLDINRPSHGRSYDQSDLLPSHMCCYILPFKRSPMCGKKDGPDRCLNEGAKERAS